MDERSRYFQEIARAFFARRGAPLFLSPKDLSLIEDWEKSGIPPAVALEGIERSFEKTGFRAGGRGKILALAYCDPAVRRAFDQHRDRKVGGRRTPAAPKASEARAKAGAAVEEFLSRASRETPDLEEPFLEARRALRGAGENARAGDELDRLDGRVDAILLARAGTSDREEAAREVRSRHPGLPVRERAAAAERLLLKRLRDKYRVPYLSLYYY
jgi:hypothetical protein